jgi:hypothetical protein
MITDGRNDINLLKFINFELSQIPALKPYNFDPLF